MNRPNFSKTTTHVLTALIILVGGGALLHFDMLWPEIVLIIGLALALKQFLNGSVFDPIASLVIFGSMYLTTKINIGWEVLIPLPALIFVVGFFILLHEYFLRKEKPENSMDHDDF
jgi:hypothetical protein